jgi:stalled ribosome rescue protein Dom34
MILLNDLRVGNHVSYQGEIFQVDDILTSLHNRLVIHNDEIETEVDHSEVEGVVLTEAMLEGKGFTSSYRSMDMIKNVQTSQGEVEIVLGMWEEFKELTLFGLGISRYDTEFKYLHQLENIFYMHVGEELNLNI